MRPFGLHLLQAGVPPSQELLVAPNPDHFAPWLVATILKIVILFTIYLVGVALLTLAERKIAGWIQDAFKQKATWSSGERYEILLAALERTN